MEVSGKLTPSKSCHQITLWLYHLSWGSRGWSKWILRPRPHIDSYSIQPLPQLPPPAGGLSRSPREASQLRDRPRAKKSADEFKSYLLQRQNWQIFLICWKSGAENKWEHSEIAPQSGVWVPGWSCFLQAVSQGHGLHRVTHPGRVWVSLLETTQEDIMGLEVSTVRES